MNCNMKYLANKTQNRTKILNALLYSTYNPHQLSKELGIEYKTVIHHLKVLKENGILKEEKAGKRMKVYEVEEEMKEKVENVIIGKNNLRITIITNHLKIKYLNNILNEKIYNYLNRVLKTGKEVKIKENGVEIYLLPLKDKEEISRIIISAQD